MKIEKKSVFILLAAQLIFFSLIFNAAAVDPPTTTDYKRYYQKYVDSKELLSILPLKDVEELRKSEQNLLSQYSSSIPLPITLPYGSLDIQELDIYRPPGEGLNPIIFFIHPGAADKAEVIFAVPAWLSMGYTVVSINHRSIPEYSFPEMLEDCNTALKWVIAHGHNFF